MIIVIITICFFVFQDTTCTCVGWALVPAFRDSGCLPRRCFYLSAAVSTRQAIRLSRDNGPEIRAEEYQRSLLRVISGIITTLLHWPQDLTANVKLLSPPNKDNEKCDSREAEPRVPVLLSAWFRTSSCFCLLTSE